MTTERVRKLCDGEDAPLAGEQSPVGPRSSPATSAAAPLAMRARTARQAAPVPETVGLNALDRERAASLADEGGAAGAIVERQETLPQAEEVSMLFEISVIPVGGDIHLSDELAGVLSVIDRSGLPYQLGPGSTCIEGEWDEAMALIRDCHREARRFSKHVITLIKVEDDEGQRDKLRTNVESVQQKAGRPLETCVDSQATVMDPGR